jgi:hypothetical protein
MYKVRPIERRGQKKTRENLFEVESECGKIYVNMFLFYTCADAELEQLDRYREKQAGMQNDKGSISEQNRDLFRHRIQTSSESSPIGLFHTGEGGQRDKLKTGLELEVCKDPGLAQGSGSSLVAQIIL